MTSIEIIRNANNDISEFDGTDPHSIFDWAELIPTLIVYGLSFMLGLTGNCLIIFTTFRYRRMHSVTNIFLSSLASSDLLLIIFCIPVKVAKLFSYTWTMGRVLCKSVHYMQNLSTICSVLTLTAISIERYYAIVHPVRSKYICTLSQAKTIILIIWVISILLAVPTLLIWVLMPVGLHNEYFWCVRDQSNQVLWKSHELYLLILILIVPFSIMTYSYTIICWEVWKIMEQRCVMTNDRSLEKKPSNNLNSTYTDEVRPLEHKKIRSKIKNCRDDTSMVKQVIYMLVTVIALFATCWSPILIDNILTAYEVLPSERSGFLKYMLSTFHLMSYFNSCINPIIYGFMSKTFRDSFRLALCCSSDSNTFIHRTGSNYSMRYYAIVHPVRSKYICTLSQAKTIILIIWVISILLAVPTLLIWVLMPVGLHNEYFWCVRDQSNQVLWKSHELYLLILILIVPFSIMTYSYTIICWEVWKIMEQRCVMTNDRSLEKKPSNNLNSTYTDEVRPLEHKKIRSKIKNCRDDTSMVKQVIYMLVTVIALFATCWSPILIDNILTAYEVLPSERSGFLKYMLSTFHLMSYFNSCINPIIYGFMSKTFRDSFRLALCCSSDSNTFIHRTGSNYSMRYISRNGSQTRTTADVRRQESSLVVV